MSVTTDARISRRVYGGSLVGWIMDAFDLSMMFLLVPIMADVFFPAKYGLAIVGTWSIYTTTFIFRPVGGALFGRLGDLIGRKNTMMITLTGLGLIVFATGFLPTYAQVGILAPILLFIFRAITGTFAGGEYGNGAAILVESVNPRRRGLWGALLQSGYPIGYTLAALVYLSLHYVIPASEFAEVGWRWMFWIGLIPAIAGLAVRLAMPESIMWEDLKKRGQVNKAPLTTILRNKAYLLNMIAGALAMTGIAWVYGLTLGFFPTLLSYHGFLKFPFFLYVVIVAILISLIGYLASGALSDGIGRRSTMIIFSAIAVVLSIPLSYLILTHAYGYYGTMALASLMAFITTGIYGVIPAYLSEKFPTSIRSTGVGFSFNGGFILGNWSTVFLLLISSLTSPSFYAYWGIFIIVGELFIMASALTSKETKGARLE
ncbi:MFS transporter [Thermocladium modestius]|uniref:MFS transporter n=1 Tax=Thermocladium modestius TaxID=62609 RepID=A0A830GVE9_9CREN|nr:MFS transporter [Thermocladium modestius]GGP21546.1 MFS transporter [Thermocladium modestius]